MPGITEHHLDVTDSRTGKSYTIPIQGDYIRAADVARIGAPDSKEDLATSLKARPLHIIDNGFQYTACMESSITHMYVSIILYFLLLIIFPTYL